MKYSRQPKLEVTTSPGLNCPARDSMTSPTAAAVQRFAQLERRNVRFPVVHAAAHVWVHRHVAIANQHLLVLQRLQFGPRQGKVAGGWPPVGAEARRISRLAIFDIKLCGFIENKRCNGASLWVLP